MVSCVHTCFIIASLLYCCFFHNFFCLKWRLVSSLFNINLCTNGIHKVDSKPKYTKHIHYEQEFNVQCALYALCYTIHSFTGCFIVYRKNGFGFFSSRILFSCRFSNRARVAFYFIFFFQSVKSETLIYGFMFIAKSHLFISIEKYYTNFQWNTKVGMKKLLY